MDFKPKDPSRLVDDFLSRSAKLERITPGRNGGPAKKAKPALTDKARARDRRDRLLVEDDGLYFRIAEPIGALSSRLRQRRVTERSQKVAAAFRRAFRVVWTRRTNADRYALLQHWRGTGDDDMPVYPEPATHPIPVIQLASTVPPSHGNSYCNKLGAEFAFPLSLAAERADRLRREIARALAVAWRYATRRHWRLILEQIEEPLASWEAEQKRSASARGRKLHTLEKNYLRAHQADLEAVLRRWGFEDAAASERENAKR
ncbi:MAG TPA: hypothetical protein VMS17_12800 [Gemmataceae bacterium]|nr:hypothetical protein [Gemmataceae bacterium]